MIGLDETCPVCGRRVAYSVCGGSHADRYPADAYDNYDDYPVEVDDYDEADDG